MKKYIPHVVVATIVLAALAYGLTRMNGLWITNSQIDSTPIGQTTPAAVNATSVSASSGGQLSGTFSGNPTFSGTATFTNTIQGNALTSSAFLAVPTQCSGGQFSTGVQANGNANCTALSASKVVGVEATGCSTSSSSYDACGPITMSYSLSTVTGYSCSVRDTSVTPGNSSSNDAPSVVVNSVSTTSIVVYVQTLAGRTASPAQVSCTITGT